jgi:hypothetical protein
VFRNAIDPYSEFQDDYQYYHLIPVEENQILLNFSYLKQIHLLMNNSTEMNEFIKSFKLKVDLKDRKYRLKTYKNCFLGTEAVDFISLKLDLPRGMATKLGEMIRKIGIFDHVTGDHIFKDEYYFYFLKGYETRRKGAISTPLSYVKNMDFLFSNLNQKEISSNSSEMDKSPIVQLKEMDLSNFDINYDSFFCYPDINSVILQFIHNDLKMKPYPPLEFINCLFKLHKLYEKKKQHLFCEEIIQEFIVENSNKEIYMNPLDRQNLLKEFETSTRTDGEFYDELFSIVADHQIQEISRDVFPKFIRSKKCLQILSKYQNDENVLKPTNFVKFPYRDSDFEREYINKMDVEFIKSLIKDDASWELIESIDQNFHIYYTETDTLKNLENIKNLQYFKFDITFQAPIEQCICALATIKQQIKFNPSICGYKKLNEKNYQSLMNIKKKDEVLPFEKSSIVGIFDIKYEFPLNTLRKCPISIGVNYQKNIRMNDLLIIMKPCLSETLKKEYSNWGKKYQSKENKMVEEFYLMFEYVAIYFKKLDDNKTQYTEIHISDYGGGWSQNENLRKKNIIERGKELKDIIRNEMKLFPNATMEEYKNQFSTDSIGKLVLESVELEIQNPTKIKKNKSIFL